ncbi:hypothetical protein [Devosia sp. Naph2]|uniref:hypothetical protein n=1 Tax=Devosia polycyclovorans TaxID=3345148 RepID=UPI0035CEF289
MAPKTAGIVLLTDAPLGENRFPKGTSFTVVDKLPRDLGPGEVDKSTAAAWKRLGWVRDAKPSIKPPRGDDAG